MSNITRIEFVNQGFRDLLNSAEVRDLVESEAQAIASRAGEGFEARTIKKATRWIAVVNTTDKASEQAESENKVLTRAVIPHA